MKIATLAIITRGNQILLGLKRNGCEIGDNTLNGPGGKQEPDETLIECLVRETKEEANIILDPTKVEKVAIITFHKGRTRFVFLNRILNWFKWGNVPDFEVHVYRTSEFTGEPHETESMIPDWYDIEPLPVERMLESDYAWFPQLVRGDKFNAHVFYLNRAKRFDRIKFFPFVDHN
ncbi:MAG: NUDIX domain-containing protein [Candidatus Paceibacterota bacterium]|jgi:8-oxo-dGTP diphosphatase